MKKMKSLQSLLASILLISGLFAGQYCFAEDWKGKAETGDFSFAALGGLGVVDSSGGLTLMGAVARKISEPGFISDLNDAVSVELEIGPLLVSGGNALFYSTHLRWDFRKDATLTLYALGGLSGFSSGSGLGSHFELFPRFGAGAMWKLNGNWAARAEVSHEFIGGGLAFFL